MNQPDGAPSPKATSLVPFGVVSLCYFGTIGFFNPFSPLWLQSLGWSTLAIGLLSSLQSWTRIVVPYAWSWWGDHSGQRVRLLRLAALGTVLSALALLGAREQAAVAVVVMLLFACNGGIVPLSEAALSRHVVDSGGFDAGRYGRVRVWGSVGFIITVLSGGAVLEALGVEAFPALVLALNLCLWVAALRLPRGRVVVQADDPPPPVWPVLRQPQVLWFFASVALTVLSHTALYAFFSLFLERQGYSKSAVGGFWALAVVFEIAFFWWQGRFFARRRPGWWLRLAGSVTAVRVAALALGGAFLPVLLLTQAAHALTFAAHHAACTAELQRLFPGRLRGRGQALYATLGYGLPGVIGGVGGGWLVQHLGFQVLHAGAALAAVLGVWCVWKAERAAVM